MIQPTTFSDDMEMVDLVGCGYTHGCIYWSVYKNAKLAFLAYHYYVGNYDPNDWIRQSATKFNLTARLIWHLSYVDKYSRLALDAVTFPQLKQSLETLPEARFVWSNAQAS